MPRPEPAKPVPRAWHRRILLADERPARLVEPGAPVVHGDRHHGIGTAVAAHLHAYHIVRHVDLTELDFSVRVQRNPLTLPFSDYHFDWFLSGISPPQLYQRLSNLAITQKFGNVSPHTLTTQSVSIIINRLKDLLKICNLYIFNRHIFNHPSNLG